MIRFTPRKCRHMKSIQGIFGTLILLIAASGCSHSKLGSKQYKAMPAGLAREYSYERERFPDLQVTDVEDKGHYTLRRVSFSAISFETNRTLVLDYYDP